MRPIPTLPNLSKVCAHRFCLVFGGVWGPGTVTQGKCEERLEDSEAGSWCRQGRGAMGVPEVPGGRGAAPWALSSNQLPGQSLCAEFII